MSEFSRILWLIGTLAGFALLLNFKGMPALPAPNPEAVTDVVLQPFLALLWGLVGYMFNATVFGWIVTFAIKLLRLLVAISLNPGTVLSPLLPESKREGAAS